MDTLRSPAALASLVARHVVPVAGVLFLGWSPGNILLLLAVDTLLALTAMTLLVMIHVTGTDARGGPGAVHWGRVALALPLVLALCAVPVGLTLPFVLPGARWRADALASPDFLTALALQGLASTTAFVQTHRLLAARADDQRILSRSLFYVVARWVVVAGVAFLGIASLLGPRAGGALLLLVYAGASVWFELFPSHAARFIRGPGAKPIEQVIAEDLARDARRAARRAARRGRAP